MRSPLGYYLPMANNYTCEIEVTIDRADFLVEGSIEEIVSGVDPDGEPVKEAHVVVERVYPTIDGLPSEYSAYELTFLPISWRDTLVQAIHEQAFSDYETSRENR